MASEYELGEAALQDSLQEEEQRIEAFRNGRRRALYTPRPLQERPGGNIFSNGRKTSLQQLREQDQKGIHETLEKISRGKLEPDAGGLWVVGGSPQDADWQAIEEVEASGEKCDLCKSVFRDSLPGTIVLYGNGIYHFECLMLKMLADCNGDPYTAAAKYNISLTDLFTVRESLSPAIWIALRERSK